MKSFILITILFFAIFTFAETKMLGSVTSKEILRNAKTWNRYELAVADIPISVFKDKECTEQVSTIEKWGQYYAAAVFGEAIQYFDPHEEKTYDYIPKPFSYYVGFSGNGRKIDNFIGWVKGSDLVTTALKTHNQIYQKAIIMCEFGNTDEIRSYYDSTLKTEKTICPFLTFSYLYAKKKVFVNDKWHNVYLLGKTNTIDNVGDLLGWVDASRVVIWNTRQAVLPNKKNFQLRKEKQGLVYIYQTPEDAFAALSNKNIKHIYKEADKPEEPKYNIMRFPVTGFLYVYSEGKKVIFKNILDKNTSYIGKLLKIVFYSDKNYAEGYAWKVHPSGSFSQFEGYVLVNDLAFSKLRNTLSFYNHRLKQRLRRLDLLGAWKAIISIVIGEDFDNYAPLHEIIQREKDIPLRPPGRSFVDLLEKATIENLLDFRDELDTIIEKSLYIQRNEKITRKNSHLVIEKELYWWIDIYGHKRFTWVPIKLFGNFWRVD